MPPREQAVNAGLLPVGAKSSSVGPFRHATRWSTARERDTRRRPSRRRSGGIESPFQARQDVWAYDISHKYRRYSGHPIRDPGRDLATRSARSWQRIGYAHQRIRWLPGR